MTGATARPVHVAAFPNGEIGIVWDDGHESYFGGHDLRCACTCASCVDEMSGQKVLRDDRVPADVSAQEIHPVGNYAISILWSDGHDTGIYSFEKLRRICPCDECRR
jgi:DUF971 family protein